MKEIRLAWSILGRTNHVREPTQNGLWMWATEENHQELRVIADVGNEVYGEGTHWIEEREA